MQMFQEIWSRYKGKLDNKDLVRVIKEYNFLVGEQLIKGLRVPIQGIGNLSVRLMPTNYNKKIVDWGKSTKGADGKYDKIIYRTNHSFLMFYWTKPKFKIFKEYKFIPTKGDIKSRGNITHRLHKAYNEGVVYDSNFIKGIGNNIYDCYNLDGSFERTFSNFTILNVKYTSSQIKNINKVLNNDNRSAYGYRWKSRVNNGKNKY